MLISSLERDLICFLNNLVPFPTLFLIYFFYFLQYKVHPHSIFVAGVVLPALSNSSVLGFLQKFSEGRGAERGNRTQDCRIAVQRAIN
jgi:hypothetical protein